MQKKILILISVLILLDVFWFAVLAYKYYSLIKENEKLKNLVYSYQNNKNINVENNNEIFQNENSLKQQSNQENLEIPKDIIPKFDENLEDPFEEMEQFEKRMNNLFKNLDKNFSDQFEINITPKSWSYFHFSNTRIINWKKFHYEINVNSNHIRWKVVYNNPETLNDLKEKLKNLWLDVKIEWNSLKFEWKIDDVNKVLKLFNINFEEKDNFEENPNQNWIRRF